MTFSAGHGGTGLAPAALGWARRDVARPGLAWNQGDWKPSGVEAPAPTLSRAWLAAARHGSSWLVRPSPGLARRGRGPAGQGRSGQDVAWQGTARHGKART